MPPKAKVVGPVKGQMSLSSFFQKGPAAPATCTPAPTQASSSPATSSSLGNGKGSSSSSTTGSSSNTSNGNHSFDKSPEETVIKGKPDKPAASKPKRARIVDDDDEEAEFDADAPATTKKSPKKAKPAAPVAAKNSTAQDEEEEWDGEDSSEESGDGEDFSEESGDDEDSDASDDEEEDEDDSMDDDDDASYGGKKAVKRSKPQKTAKAAKTPRTITTQKPRAPITTQKPIKAMTTTFVTPAPFSASVKIAPTTQMNDLFGLCQAGVDTPMASSSSSSSSSSSKPPLILAEGVCGMGQHEHDFLHWLHPDKRQDRNGRPMSHPDFNPRTLRVDPGYLKSATPAMAQWWRIKSENMDTVLFFKVGKFYELFHMDADIGMKELDLIYMKGDKAHSGFPEVSYGKFSSILVSKGYRVARVEQTETPEMLKDRNDSKGGPKDKVVAREMCSIMSKGTRTYCHLDDLSLLEEGSAGSSVLFCINEIAIAPAADGEGEAEGGAAVQYGICSVDCVLGTVTLALFEDDKQRTRLRTMLSTFNPNEVVIEKASFSPETLGAVRNHAPQAKVEVLQPSELMSTDQVLSTLEKNKYFSSSETGYPPVLKAVLECIQAPSSTRQLVTALGSAVWMLCRSLIDFEILSMGKFYGYVPPDVEVSNHAGGESDGSGNAMAVLSTTQNEALRLGADAASDQQTMTLDAVSLANLEVLVNNFDRTEKGSLWSFMNKTKTPFGRRLLHEWIVRPLYRPADIQRRAHAVEELLTVRSIEANSSRSTLAKTPDLERLLSRVHSNGLKKKGPNHPEQRAIMYEAPVYNKRKIQDFADILSGFETLVHAVEHFNKPGVKIESALLRRAVSPPNTGASSADEAARTGGKFPLAEVKELLAHFRTIFDEKQAKREGCIKPRPGVSSDYDQATEDVSTLHKWFEAHLVEQKQATGVSSLAYWGNGKDRYQIEVPIDRCSKVPNNWESKSQKKSHRRYWTPKVPIKLAELVEAEGRVESAQKDTLRAIFAKFDEKKEVWSVAVACIALLDALQSLAFVSATPNYCWPEIRHATGGLVSAELNIVAGRHPMLEHTLGTQSDGEYIANSLHLGGVSESSSAGAPAAPTAEGATLNPRLMLLSGPNMGGKSTLLRQTCLIAIMAQMGCKVPADSVTMTPVDRIFTRVGASDRILAGQSTFFVELAETATILKLATQHSLCILDELGRGTATFDGTAIAHSVVDHLVCHTRCLAVFATHYHSLVRDWEVDPRVRLGHMSCIVDTSRANSSSSAGASKAGTTGAEEITFLYRLAAGSSPRSYGINVARLAQLPPEVIELACKQSKEFEDSLRQRGEAMDVDDDTNSGADGSSDGACTLAKAAARDSFMRYFDRLVSLASSSVPVEELAAVARELWHRYHAEVGNPQTMQL